MILGTNLHSGIPEGDLGGFVEMNSSGCVERGKGGNIRVALHRHGHELKLDPDVALLSRPTAFQTGIDGLRPCTSS